MASTSPLGSSWLRAAPKEDLAISSAELVFGAALTLPGQFLIAMEQPPADYIKQLQSFTPLPTRPALYAEAAASVTEKLMKAEYVFVRRGGVVPPLAPLYHGPYKVLKAGSKFFTISLGGCEDTVSVDRLKPHLGGPVVPALPPARGHPPPIKVAAASVLPRPLLGGPLWRSYSYYIIVVMCQDICTVTR
jgi:hypothetical protein